MTAPLTPDRERRPAKSTATSLDAVALPVFGTAFVVPAIGDLAILPSPGPRISPAAAIAPHVAAHRFLRSLPGED